MPIALQKFTRVAAICALIVLTGIPMAHAASANINFRGTVVRTETSSLQAVTAAAVSFTDSAALKVKSVNRGPDTVSVTYTAYTSDNSPLDLRTLPAKTRLQPQSAAISTIIIPLSKIGVSKVKICSMHKNPDGTVVDQTCDNFVVKRVALSE